MKGPDRSIDWLKQARNDIRWAKSSLDNGFYAQTCFICQQAAEKALKSILLRKGAAAIFSHSLTKLCDELRINAKLLKAAKILDQYYLSGRYPDAFPEGAPYELLSKEQAQDAIKQAKLFLTTAGKRVRG